MDLELKHMDVVTAFLHGDLEEEIYMKPLPGMTDCEPHQFLKLNKTLYGLKQASNRWNCKLVDSLKTVGFINLSNIDECVFTKISRTGRPLIIAAYVDDLFKLYAKEDTEEMSQCVAQLGQHFELKELGDAELALGMRITRDRVNGTLSIDQEVYLTKLLDKYGMKNCQPLKTPISKEKSVFKNPDSAADAEEPKWLPQSIDEIEEKDARAAPDCNIKLSDYRSIVGALQYAATCTRPDISQAVSELASHSNDPQREDLTAIKRILRYIKGTIDIGLIYQRINEELKLSAYSDSDWAGDKLTRRSTTGMVFMLAGAPISWRSQKQPTVSLSSTEAEYNAATEAGREIVWLRALLEGISLEQADPTTLFIDNNNAISMILDDQGNLERRKHIDVKHHWIKQLCLAKKILPMRVDTTENLADLFTKPLHQQTLIYLRKQLLRPIIRQKPQQK
jgi:hypothetical protein